MKKLVGKILVVSLVAMAFSCCRNNEIDSAFLENESIHLRVNGKNLFDFKEMSCQLGYNDYKQEYRVHDDTMADYYIVKLYEKPSEEGQSVTGEIEWTTSSDIVKKRDISFKVVKINSDHKMWLWEKTNKIGAVVMALL